MGSRRRLPILAATSLTITRSLPARPGRRVLAALATVPALLAACGSPPPDPNALLRAAKMFVDSAQTVHFQLTSTGTTGGGAVVTGGSGDAKRPDQFTGTMSVTLAGFAIDIDVLSLDGAFYVRLPTDPTYVRAHPNDYGFADPGQLLDPQHGVSSLLLRCQSVVLESDDRYNSEQLHEVGCALPGPAVAALLTSADPAQRVDATFGVSLDNQLRRVVLTGPFYNKTQRSTFTLVLDRYGENVSISAPPGPG